MNNSRATLEVIAQSVDEAIQKGLNELGLPREAVEVEVLDEGSQGVLGLGSRQARVRISLSSPTTPEQGVEGEAADDRPEQVTDFEADIKPEEAQVLSMAEEVVRELLEKMNLTAQVSGQFGFSGENLPYHPIKIDVTGDDLSMLIGKRGKTLNALQYITRLILGKELERGVPLSIDVDGYRKRREEQVRQIARRVAQQVINTGRRQALEPMPANERRFAHIELRDNSQVYTESTGEEPNRKVVIYPQD